jgi:uncharacterized SAM-binding protein YcdF (DUF218 family)
MNWIITNTLAAFLLPPLSLFMLGAVGWILLRHRRATPGKIFILLAVSLLWLLSTPLVSFQLISLLEKRIPTDTRCKPQAIVVLGAGTYFNAPEYGGDTVTDLGLERLRLAAHLHRQTNLPILVTGGRPDGGTNPEAKLMQSVLEKDFGVPVKWVEGESNNTRENALFSNKLLQRQGIDSIYLVTQAWHMPRSLSVFVRHGFCAIPAATGYHTRNRITTLSFLPDAKALMKSYIALHEGIGIIWYSLSA